MAIVSENEPITIVGGAHFSQGLLLESLELAPVVYAADGGANLCMQYGCQPVQVIGDLDSLSPSLRSKIDPSRVIHVAEQDTTDFEKLLIRVDAPMMLALGFLGGRIDHQMAVQSVLTAYSHRKIICVGDEDVMFVSPPEIELPLDAGTRVSLYPMAPVQVRSTGLYWSTDGLSFAPDGQIGTSNQATGPVTLLPSAPRMLVVLPKNCLDIAIDAVQAAPYWDAPI
jgi:thiamine pyrophosphokinase